MDCSYCKKDMADSDICPSCGMGKRLDYELFKTDKAERKKSFEDYEKEYLNRLENGDKPNNEKDKSESENKPNPDNWNKLTLPNSGSNKGLMINTNGIITNSNILYKPTIFLKQLICLCNPTQCQIMKMRGEIPLTISLPKWVDNIQTALNPCSFSHFSCLFP